jgi:hypothetical protein
MVSISIDLVPDPARDARAREAALALVTGMLYDPAGPGEEKDLSAAALNQLVEQVVGEIGEVREESAAALQHMLTVVARQYSAFAALAYAIGVEAFAAGQRAPDAPELDLPDVLSRVRQALGEAQ